MQEPFPQPQPLTTIKTKPGSFPCFKAFQTCSPERDLNYISNKNLLLRVKAEEVTTATANGKPRLNAKALVEKLDEKIQYLHNQAETLEKDLSHVEEMQADLAQIKQLMSIFNGKYHGRVAEVFNCNYFLKDNNGIQYR